MKKLNYKFKNPELLELALTQSGANSARNNERLEFLGDRVLGLSVANTLYDIFPNENEGELARRLAFLVSTKTLAEVSKNFGFDKLVKHGHMTGGKMEHIAANAMESVIAAIYIDGGWIEAYDFIKKVWTPIAKSYKTPPKDPKTTLQEMVQKSGESRTLPVYEIMSEKKGIFTIKVSAMNETAIGTGSTKKSASADAANNLLSKLQ